MGCVPNKANTEIRNNITSKNGEGSEIKNNKQTENKNGSGLINVSNIHTY